MTTGGPNPAGRNPSYAHIETLPERHAGIESQVGVRTLEVRVHFHFCFLARLVRHHDLPSNCMSAAESYPTTASVNYSGDSGADGPSPPFDCAPMFNVKRLPDRRAAASTGDCSSHHNPASLRLVRMIEMPS